jgi:hypothetical protein
MAASIRHAAPGRRVRAKIAPFPVSNVPRPAAARRCPGDAARPRPIMDIERINAIGNTLADLTERTAALRGYL